MYNRFIGGDVETHDLRPKFHMLEDAEFVGMKECIRDQGNRIAELEADVEAWREMYTDTSKQLAEARTAWKQVTEELASKAAEEKAEADLFHAAYVGMCAMHPNRALSIGHSQQEH